LLDGQQSAIRLSKQLTKLSKTMKNKVDLYNDRPRVSTVDDSTFPAVISFADVLNPAGSLFSSLRPEPECVSI